MEANKNIHILPTDKPSRLVKFFTNKFHLCKDILPIQDEEQYQNIYITNSEEIKEGDWFIANNGVHKCIRVDNNTSCPFITLNSKGEEIGHFKTWRTKIILTTDKDLIKDGVQAIDDEFLEWFVKNPSCEEVEVIYGLYNPMGRKVSNEKVSENHSQCVWKYKIIIPKEEPKQETFEDITLEEVFGSEYCQFSVVENKLAILYRNQEQLLKAIKLLSNEK